MKVLFVFLILSNLIFAQKSTIQGFSQTSTVKVSGNNNIIRVVQADKVISYKINDDRDAELFLRYLKQLPEVSKTLKSILQYDRKTYDLVAKIYERSKSGEFLNVDKFIQRYEDYIRENENLRNENNRLRTVAGESDFKKVLEDAQQKLVNYDNEGYQRILEYYVSEKLSSINQQFKNISRAKYLQAKNNSSNFLYEAALEQINQALKYDPENTDYLLLKAEILNGQFRYAQSLEEYDRVLTTAKSDSIKHAAYNNISQIYYKKEDYDKTFAYADTALSIFFKIYGTNNLNTLSSYELIGLAHYQKEDYSSALKYFNKALSIADSLDVRKDSVKAFLYLNLGFLYEAKGDSALTEKYLNKYLLLSKTVLKDWKLKMAQDYYVSSVIALNRRDSISGINNLIKCIDILEKVYGKESPATYDMYQNMAAIYLDLKNWDKALAGFQKTLSLSLKLFGPRSVNISQDYMGLANAYYYQQDFPKAVENYFNSIKFEVYDSSKQKTSLVVWSIGEKYFQRKQMNEALDCFLKALSVLEETKYSNEQRLNYCYWKVSSIYKLLNNFVKEQEYLSKSLSITF